MALRPQTLYAIADSPVGLAAWMLDHDVAATRSSRASSTDSTEGLTPGRHSRQHHVVLVDEHGGLVGSPLLGHHANGEGGLLRPQERHDPGGRDVFPDEIYAAPQSWAERAYPKLIYFNKLPKGGHFAAWEQPELFVREMRGLGFGSLRT